MNCKDCRAGRVGEMLKPPAPEGLIILFCSLWFWSALKENAEAGGGCRNTPPVGTTWMSQGTLRIRPSRLRRLSHCPTTKCNSGGSIWNRSVQTKPVGKKYSPPTKPAAPPDFILPSTVNSLWHRELSCARF